MPWQRKTESKPKGGRVVRRKQADGTIKEYRYAAYKPKQARQAVDTIGALIDAYQTSPEWHALAANTRAWRTGYLKPLARIGHAPVVEVSRREIIALHDAMRERGDGAAKGFLMAAAAVFAWAVDKMWIEHSPVTRIKSAPGGQHRAWTRQEADAAQRLLPPYLARVIVLARHTGQRRGDLCAMLWSAYDGNVIRLTQQKTKPGSQPVKLTIPVAPALRAELDAWKAEAKAVTILTNGHGVPWNAATLTKALPDALAKIGLPRGLNVHGLRKLAAAELAQAGCSVHEIASITGHRTLRMVEHYTRSADQTRLAQSALGRLETFQTARQAD